MRPATAAWIFEGQVQSGVCFPCERDDHGHLKPLVLYVPDFQA